MLKISKKLKLEIFKLVISQSDPFAESKGEERIIKFLSKIWDLESMPSLDPRFDDASGDIVQHFINNPDWDYEYLFTERLGLIEDDHKFEIFIETLLSSEIRNDEDDITKYYFLLNPILEKEGLALTIDSYDESNYPLYKIKQLEDVEKTPLGLVENKIPFFVVKSLSGHSAKLQSHKTPSTSPAFVLVQNDGWNDFGYKTEFSLFYYDAESVVSYVGETKIMKIDIEDTIESIPKRFFSLEADFCSLGQTYDFYYKLKGLLKKNFESVLFAIRDSAFFPDIHDNFENNYIFKKSLIRTDKAERLLREAKYKVLDYDLSNLYSFSFDFKPKFSDISVTVTFDFKNNSDSPDRIYGLIGKNATGKTQLITSLPIEIANNNSKLFSPRTPLFSKVIAVSYSVFDTFVIPSKTASFNYVYCGLKDKKGELISNQGLILRFHHTWKKIKELSRMEEWREILLNFIEEELINEFIVLDNDEKYDVSIDGFSRVRAIMSSGQNIILYIVTEIVANIRYDSLLLYDEPETHLHPNAISQLVNAIYELVNKFESYCILATHSPLIIRELLSKNVLVIERNGNVPSVRKIGIESFGENLTVLTEEVFGNRAVNKQHKIILQKMVDEGKSYDQIISLLESDGLPLSLNVLMLIRSLTNEKS
ncbi:MAG: AAA family ATPase [Pyrinomonadaceae bacterium]